MSGFTQQAIAQLIEDLRYLQDCPQKYLLTENALGTRLERVRLCIICVPFQSVRIRVTLLPGHIAKGVHSTLFPMRELGFSANKRTRFLWNAISFEISFVTLWNTFWNAFGTPTGYIRAVY